MKRQSIVEEINPEYSLEGLMLKLKLSYLGHLMQRADLSLSSMWWKKIIAEVQFYTQINNSAKIKENNKSKHFQTNKS